MSNQGMTTASADAKMAAVNKKFRTTGMTTGAFSGLTYGIYTVLVLVAGYYEPLVSAAGLLAGPYVCSGLNDLFAGIWLTAYNAKSGRIREMGRSLNTFPGKMIVVGSILGGPIANGAYLVGLAMAGAYAIPISALCSLFGAIFAWIFLKQKITKRVMMGMLVCVAGAIIINWTKPEGSDNFTLGIIFSFVAAICWALEGVFATYGGAMIDTDVAVNLRQLISGIVDLFVIVPIVGGLGLLGGTLMAGIPAIWLAVSGLSAAVSFLCWYKSNSTVGCAVGMSLNVTYAFWGVFFCILFLGQAVTPTIVIGSFVIVFGAILVTMNPLDLFRKGE
ncbi:MULTISPECIES: DMT family transporter [Clostridia]|uniref:Membrane protein n=1 Tax=Lacrimispora celerecrescens TaxID=29354 RepID=A0A084JFN5_9FIRM|nr:MULTISPECIES: DMT family transporter [Clostridia]KEZ87769.1 membrane protein [Lacrimispora celerecrescens]MBW4846452.1 DMT family transporter [Lachnospiraceae bacterium]MSS11065.1 DMT family transporter [Clostridium sp. WB02_MRS01]